MTKEVYVGGFDIASVSSGCTYIRAEWNGRDVSVEAVYERAYKVPNTFVGHFECAKLMLKDSCSFREAYGLNLCAVEDYTMQSLSMVSFSIGEMGGLVRGFHFDAGFPILLNKPMIMRSFAADGRKLPKGAPGKRALMQCALEDFGYISGCHYSKERSDCCDALLHAVLGAYTLFILSGALSIDSLSPKRRDIWRNKKCTGILDNISERLLTPADK